MHEACAEKVRNSIEQEYEAQVKENNGSYLSGFIGAIIGSVLGGIVWAIILMVGYIASIVGLLIGWLAEKGYRLFKGKNGKGKIIILVIAVFFGVLFGTFAGDGITLAQMINSGELPGFTYGDIPAMFTILLRDSEYAMATVKNICLGLLFAALGVFSLIRRNAKEVSATKIYDLR